MTDDVKAFFEGLRADRQKMKEQTPNVTDAFAGFCQALMKEGALSVRDKELIALGIGMAVKCVPCINLHVRGCLRAGATREQILEAAGVAVMMRGGPVYTHMPEVIHALDHLEQR